MIFSVAVVRAGYVVCSPVKYNRFTDRLEKIDKVIVTMVQASPRPATCVTGIAVCETSIIVFFVFTGAGRIPMTGSTIGEDIWASNPMAIVTTPCPLVRLRAGRIVALIAITVKVRLIRNNLIMIQIRDNVDRGTVAQGAIETPRLCSRCRCLRRRQS
jgi:hypothetical protein